MKYQLFYDSGSILTLDKFGDCIEHFATLKGSHRRVDRVVVGLHHVHHLVLRHLLRSRTSVKRTRSRH